MNQPWVHVHCDAAGVPTITVKESHLVDFPHFMRSVIKEKIGLAQGVFKIMLEKPVASSTTLQNLIDFVTKYFSTGSGLNSSSSNEFQYPDVHRQTFFQGVHGDHLYGYSVPDDHMHNPQLFEENKQTILREISDPGTFINQTTCCLQRLNESQDALDSHYWQKIEKHAGLSVGFKRRKVNITTLKKKAKHWRKKYCPDSTLTDEEFEHSKANVSAPKQHLPLPNRGTQSHSLLYAPGIPVKKGQFPITPEFDLSKLETIIDLYPVKTPGVTEPYLYVSIMPHASFPWHIEDMALFSINYLHYGAPSVCGTGSHDRRCVGDMPEMLSAIMEFSFAVYHWVIYVDRFVIPPEDYQKFVAWARHFYLNLAHTSCSNVLGHKYILAAKTFLQKIGIQVATVIQNSGQFVVTYPFAAHSGFKMGKSFSQASNFGDEFWVELGLVAPTCVCFPHQLKMDLTEIIAVSKPHLLMKYINCDFFGLMEELHKNQFIRMWGLLSDFGAHFNHTGESLKEVRSHSVNEATDTDISIQEEQAPLDRSISNDFKGARCVIQCPEVLCPKVYEGGRAKIPRMISHIEKKHQGCENLLLKLEVMYPPRGKPTKYLLCPHCGDCKAGGVFEMNLHVKRKHPHITM